MAASFLSRTWRLQFSLRALLLLLTLVGIGLMVYRWPWKKVESAFPPTNGQIRPIDNFAYWDQGWRCQPRIPNHLIAALVSDSRSQDVVVTYRRGWNGKPLRHGAAEYWSNSLQNKTLLSRWDYYDDNLRKITNFEPDGRIVHFENYQDGVWHGEFMVRDDLGSERGFYDRGQRQGMWETVYECDDRDNHLVRVQLTHSFRDGLFHGDWIWKSTDGHVLQTAKYDSGQLIEWNGKPKRQALQELLTSSGLSAETRDRLLAPHNDMWFQTVQLQPANSTAQLQYLELRIDRQWTGVGIWQFRKQSDATRLSVAQINFLQHKGVGPLTVVLEHALAHSETLVCRDGRLHLEKIHRLVMEK